MSKRNEFLKFVQDGIEDFSEEDIEQAMRVLKGETKGQVTFTVPPGMIVSGSNTTSSNITSSISVDMSNFKFPEVA